MNLQRDALSTVGNKIPPSTILLSLIWTVPIFIKFCTSGVISTQEEKVKCREIADMLLCSFLSYFSVLSSCHRLHRCTGMDISIHKDWVFCKLVRPQSEKKKILFIIFTSFSFHPHSYHVIPEYHSWKTEQIKECSPCIDYVRNYHQHNNTQILLFKLSEMTVHTWKEFLTFSLNVCRRLNKQNSWNFQKTCKMPHFPVETSLF